VKRLVVLISGRGSNMSALARACSERRWPARIEAVVASRADSPGLDCARRAGIHAEAIAPVDYPGREAFEAALADRLAAFDADLVLLAGFMRILGDDFVRRHQGRLVNIHPSLLPAYPGMHTHRRALHDGVRIHGATVHLVTPSLDHGPILAQAAVPVLSGDDEARLSARVLRVEHRLYPDVVEWMVQGRVSVRDGRVAIDGVADEARLLFDPSP
jgi:phosphoribosylglycinamide formyltransferase 1